MALVFILLLVFNFGTVFAKIGDNGFEGGISSGGVLTPLNSSKANATQTYSYKEVVLVTGTPIVFTGTVTISKTVRNEAETFTYNYSLTNGTKNKLTRSAVYESIIKENGNQTIRIMANKSGSRPRENIVIDGITYTLDTINNQNFSLSTISDTRPACEYYAGNWNSERSYRTNNGKKVTVSMTSKMYGYDQYWGSTETQEISVSVSGLTEQVNVYDKWGGTGTIKISSVTSSKLNYIENTPDAISFGGGYLKRQENTSILNYNLRLPLFDSKGIATDTIVNYSDILELASFPHQERLSVIDTSAIRGHWYEENVKQLLSLGIIDNSFVSHYSEFDKHITRKEFAKAIIETVKMELLEIPVANTRVSRNAVQEPVETLPFYDVSTEDAYYQYIYTLYKKGVMSGTAENWFSPNEPLSRAQALVIFVRMLGLEAIAQDTAPITSFNDNDSIPSWARNAVLVATKIGLVRGDEYNNLKPNENLTKAEAATLINNLIYYMRDDMVKDYRDSAISY